MSYSDIIGKTLLTPYPVQYWFFMVDTSMETEEEVTTMVLDGENAMTPDEQLAFIIKRFNLDWETIEAMPAFEVHRKLLFSRELEK